jgi:hypothetical protein
VLDREIRHTYDLLVKATNDHQYLTTQVDFNQNLNSLFKLASGKFEILLQMSDAEREKRQAMDHDPSTPRSI